MEFSVGIVIGDESWVMSKEFGAEHGTSICIPTLQSSHCSLIVLQILTWKQRLVKAEETQVAYPHRIKNAEQMIGFVLHDARVKSADFAIDGIAELIAPLIAQIFVARHQATHA